MRSLLILVLTMVIVAATVITSGSALPTLGEDEDFDAHVESILAMVSQDEELIQDIMEDEEDVIWAALANAESAKEEFVLLRFTIDSELFLNESSIKIGTKIIMVRMRMEVRPLFPNLFKFSFSA
jgi:hypothetical protein